jgi:hypothetical protein
MNRLEQAARQALHALKAMQSCVVEMRCGLRICDEAIDQLEAALAQPQQAEPVVIPGAIPMSEIAARSQSMPERAEALERARKRLEQAEPVADSGNPSY